MNVMFPSSQQPVLQLDSVASTPSSSQPMDYHWITRMNCFHLCSTGGRLGCWWARPALRDKTTSTITRLRTINRPSIEDYRRSCNVTTFTGRRFFFASRLFGWEGGGVRRGGLRYILIILKNYGCVFLVRKPSHPSWIIHPLCASKFDDCSGLACEWRTSNHDFRATEMDRMPAAVARCCVNVAFAATLADPIIYFQLIVECWWSSTDGCTTNSNKKCRHSHKAGLCVRVREHLKMN